MKPLILILLVSITAEAQNLADAARQERARQAQYKSTRVFSDANAHLLKPIAPAEPLLVPVAGSKELATKNSPAAAAALNAAAAAAAPAPTPGPDPILEEMQKLRVRVRALEDQETSLKLQITDITNQVYAPLSDSGTHNEALTKLGETQAKLADVQRELGQARISLQQLEIQASAKK
jgi:hypothetical protein